MTIIQPSQYRRTLDNCSCEVSMYLRDVKSWNTLTKSYCGLWGTGAAKYLERETDQLTTHHIYGGTARDNYLSNLIAVHRLTHIEWGHKHPQQFRVVCLWAKKQKGEFDMHELNAAAGLTRNGASILGRLETYDLEPPFSEWREELTR